MPEAQGAGPVAGIVLAAGRSTRMGENKLLLDAGGEPLLRRVVRHSVAAGLDPVLVVLGFESERAATALEGLRWEPVVNPDFAAGINASLRAGIAHVPADRSAAVVLLADMPFVTGEMIAAVVVRYRETAAPLVVSTYGGVQAPPTLYGRTLFAELMSGAEGEGAGKQVARRHRQAAAAVAWPLEALTDIDRPDDYRAATARLGGTPAIIPPGARRRG